MSYTEKESRIQEQFWFQHVTELTLDTYRARIIRDMINEYLDGYREEEEVLVIHFVGATGMPSIRFQKYVLDSITTILDSQVCCQPIGTYKPDRYVEATRLISYFTLISDILKSE